jgi:neutral trehalase
MQQTPGTSIQPKDYKRCLQYIEKYWKEITCDYPTDHYKQLGLPNKFVSPNHDAFRNDQFYWDSYFIILGLVKCGRTELAKGMIDNLLFLQKKCIAYDFKGKLTICTLEHKTFAAYAAPIGASCESMYAP